MYEWEMHVEAELCSPPVALSVWKCWVWGRNSMRMGCLRKVCFGAEDGARFTWQAKHFVDLRSSWTCVLCFA